MRGVTGKQHQHYWLIRTMQTYISRFTSGSSNFRPIYRLVAVKVLCGLVTAFTKHVRRRRACIKVQWSHTKMHTQTDDTHLYQTFSGAIHFQHGTKMALLKITKLY